MVNAAKSIADARSQPGKRSDLPAGRENTGIRKSPWKVSVSRSFVMDQQAERRGVSSVQPYVEGEVDPHSKSSGERLCAPVIQF
jgi:hypothetical protein